MEISKNFHCKDLSFLEKNYKLNEKIFFYNQSTKDAKNQINQNVMH